MNAKTTRPFPLIVILFCLIIFTVPFLWALWGNDPQEISIIEGRRLTRFSTTDLDLRRTAGRLARGSLDGARDAFLNFINTRSDQVLFENAASDQFPLRLNFVRAVKAIERQVILMVYAPLKDPAIPTDMRSGFYIMRDASAIIYGPVNYTDSSPQVIDERIANYQSLMAAYPAINFFAYHIDRLQYSPYDPLNDLFPEADAGRSLAYFEQYRPRDLAYASMDLDSFEQHRKNFYNADHHWNIQGILLAYDDIYNLLAEKNPGISPQLEPGSVVTFPGAQFLGHTARITFYPIEGDEFAAVDLNLPPHQILSFGQEVENYNLSERYLDGHYSTAPYFYHFSEFFGGNQAFLEYVFENGSGRDLLVLGDSFKIPLHPMLASHYHHTYMINMPLYPDFDLSDFLDQHPVDDILIIGGNNVLFLDPNWAIKL